MTSSPPSSQLEALRRSVDDKLVAGVAGGVGRALKVDPVIVRIGFVVLTFIGFSGPILYIACWLLIPREGAERSALGEAFDVRSDSQLRTAGLTVAAVLVVLAILGDTAWDGGVWIWGPLWVLIWLAIPAAALYWLFVARPRQNARRQFAPPPPYRPAAAGATHTDAEPFARPQTGETAMTTRLEHDEPTAVLDGPPVGGPPPGVVPRVATPPRPPRDPWSPALLLVTLSAIVATMGALALWSVTQEPLAASVYVAAALAVVALGLLVGTKMGHPGALIPLGVVLLPVLAVASVAPNLSAGNVDLRPLTAAAVADPIEQGFGRVHVDLTAIAEPESLTGRSLQIRNGMGETTVVVPRDVDVSVDASLSAGGRIEVFGRVSSGQSPSMDKPSDAPGAYLIDIHGTAGEIEVVRR